MGPLVPDVIGNDLNYVVALFIGIAFGFILEQGGFSTSKKLVGLFYGYDFTVLRVFFTAGVTAMIGVVALGHFGLLDTSLILINPTFLWSAIVGGLIMGLGFILGGFCPGTSICGAAIGKIDAMVFVVGSFFGILAFAEGYPLFEGLYKAANWGNVRIFDTLGMSQSLFAFILLMIAVGAFWMVAFIEQKVNGKPNPELRPVRLYVGISAVAVLIALSAFLLPDRKESLIKEANDEKYASLYQVKTMSADELAFRLIDNADNLQIFDLRRQKEYDSLTLPYSRRINLENIFEKETEKVLSIRHMKNVFIADDEISAKKGAILAEKMGFSEVYVLQGGLLQFKKDILEFKKPLEIKDKKDVDTFRFREKAAQLIPVLIKEYKQKQSAGENKAVKRKLVGC
jgi:rhodanese-related sulfurtransferase